MAATVKPIPDGYHTVTPYLVADDAKALLAFIQKAFGATFDHEPIDRPDGKLMHAALTVGTSRVMVANSSERAPATKAMTQAQPATDSVQPQAESIQSR